MRLGERVLASAVHREYGDVLADEAAIDIASRVFVAHHSNSLSIDTGKNKVTAVPAPRPESIRTLPSMLAARCVR